MRIWHWFCTAVYLFGTFGYEMDLNLLSEDEMAKVKKQITFMKEHRELIQMKGDFYRLLSPFDGNDTSWMVVSPDKTEAIVGFYQRLNKVNGSWLRLRLDGLDPEKLYDISVDLSPSETFDYELAKLYGIKVEKECVKTFQAYGDELMHAGLVIDRTALNTKGGDFTSLIYVLKEA